MERDGGIVATLSKCLLMTRHRLRISVNHKNIDASAFQNTLFKYCVLDSMFAQKISPLPNHPREMHQTGATRSTGSHATVQLFRGFLEFRARRASFIMIVIMRWTVGHGLGFLSGFCHRLPVSAESIHFPSKHRIRWTGVMRPREADPGGWRARPRQNAHAFDA